jgi:AraC-like DNA-binding protein
MIQRWKLTQLGGMECTSGVNLTHHFPFHFHYEYSIGISLRGLQRFDLLGDSLLVPPGSVMLVNPREMHAHFSLNDLGWDYKMLYVPTDIIQYLRKKGLLNPSEQLFGPTLLTNAASYSNWSAFFSQTEEISEELLFSLISATFKEGSPKLEISPKPTQMEDIKKYLEAHFPDKLDLNALAKKFRVDKFQLIRHFKKHTGVTPQVFLTIVRVEKARKFLDEQYPLVEAALEAGFYDQSHFHRYFHRFTSFTPGQYRTRQADSLQP